MSTGGLLAPRVLLEDCVEKKAISFISHVYAGEEAAALNHNLTAAAKVQQYTDLEAQCISSL